MNRPNPKRRMTRRTWVGAAVTAWAAPLVAGEWVPHWHKTRTPTATGIPSLDTYQYRTHSDTRVVVSQRALLLRKRVLDVVDDGLVEDPLRFPQASRTTRSTEYLTRRPDGSTAIDRTQTDVFDDRNDDQQIHEESARMTRETIDQPRVRESDRLDAAAPNRYGLLLGRTPMVSDPLTRSDEQSTSRVVSRWPAREERIRAKRIAFYQLELPTLTVEHCSISGVALQLHSDGQWVLSLRGDQHARPEPGTPVDYRPTLYIKRNEFVVRVRCYGSFVNEAEKIYVTAGKPVLVELPETRFWVQNGEPRYIRQPGHAVLVREQFDLIDRAEVEFFYMKESGYRRTSPE